jgi:hypothetical protein
MKNTDLFTQAYEVSRRQLVRSKLKVRIGGWGLHYNDAWDLLDELSRNPHAELWQRMLLSDAQKNGLESVRDQITICGWPVLEIGRYPTTIALVGIKVDEE